MKDKLSILPLSSSSSVSEDGDIPRGTKDCCPKAFPAVSSIADEINNALREATSLIVDNNISQPTLFELVSRSRKQARCALEELVRRLIPRDYVRESCLEGLAEHILCDYLIDDRMPVDEQLIERVFEKFGKYFLVELICRTPKIPNSARIREMLLMGVTKWPRIVLFVSDYLLISSYAREVLSVACHSVPNAELSKFVLNLSGFGEYREFNYCEKFRSLFRQYLSRVRNQSIEVIEDEYMFSSDNRVEYIKPKFDDGFRKELPCTDNELKFKKRNSIILLIGRVIDDVIKEMI